VLREGWSCPQSTPRDVRPHGLREAAYDELDLVRDWRDYLAELQRYLRHLLA